MFNIHNKHVRVTKSRPFSFTAWGSTVCTCMCNQCDSFIQHSSPQDTTTLHNEKMRQQPTDSNSGRHRKGKSPWCMFTRKGDRQDTHSRQCKTRREMRLPPLDSYRESREFCVLFSLEMSCCLLSRRRLVEKHKHRTEESETIDKNNERQSVSQSYRRVTFPVSVSHYLSSLCVREDFNYVFSLLFMCPEERDSLSPSILGHLFWLATRGMKYLWRTILFLDGFYYPVCRYHSLTFCLIFAPMSESFSFSLPHQSHESFCRVRMVPLLLRFTFRSFILGQKSSKTFSKKQSAKTTGPILPFWELNKQTHVGNWTTPSTPFHHFSRG